jgi:hypothetical protein
VAQHAPRISQQHTARDTSATSQPSAHIEARPNKRRKLPRRQRAIAGQERSPHLALMVADALAPDPLGTRERLVFALLLYTGQRSSDVGT